ncbi:MAG: DUF192 domain-containing protein [Elusimicrobia bacterium]|nr:DUF192 domain-containing protein [Elusimicrobiota bacterium]
MPIVLALAFALPALAAQAGPSSTAPGAAPQSGLTRARLKFPDGKTISVDLAATPLQREVGLMNRTRLPKDYGMLFVFPVEQGLQFWMKNTLVDLDMVFIDHEGRVTAFYPRVPRSELDTPEDKLARRSGLAQYVLELPAGAGARHKLKVGQKLGFAVAIPPN